MAKCNMIQTVKNIFVFPTVKEKLKTCITQHLFLLETAKTDLLLSPNTLKYW